MGTPSSSHISLLHCMELMSNNIVRLALDGSVTNDAPAVSFHTNHESMVPIHRCSVGGTVACCNNHAALVPEKYGSSTRPVTARTRSRCGSNSVQRSAVRRSCHTMALAHGFPVRLSHARTVSRWFVIPIAAMGCESRLHTSCNVATMTSQISSASCSTQPG